MTNSTMQRFNAIRWHDSKLVCLCFHKAGEEDRVKISLELLGNDDSLTPAEIIFKEGAYTTFYCLLCGLGMRQLTVTGCACQ